MHLDTFSHFEIIICSILSMEVFFRLNCTNIFFTIKKVSLKVGKILSSKYISDHWKEIVLPHYASILFFSSFKILIIFLIIILIFFLPAYFKNNMRNNFITMLEIFESIAICFFYFKVRKFYIE